MAKEKSSPAKTGRKQDGTFAKGCSSPNPKGRPQGSRNKATILAQSMLDGKSEELVNKVIDLALSGDQTMLRICLERLVPTRKDAPLSIRLPKIDGIESAANGMKRILKAVATSNLTPDEGNRLIIMVEKYLGTVELAALEARVKKLEDGN